jgi:succinate dehydrogenase / fumarate reductase cytochrome b subunit
MALKRDVSLLTGVRYRGQGPMLTFILHRIGGLGMLILVSTHILSSFAAGDLGTLLNDLYKHWAFQLVVFFCALFHAVNGLRITLLDLWPRLLTFQREAMWVEWAVFIPLYGLTALVIARTALGS